MLNAGTEGILFRLETAMEAGGMAWWEMELPTGAIFFSPNKTAMLGYKADDFFHYKHFTDLVHPEDYEPMMAAMRDHVAGKTDTYETTYRIKCADGTYACFYDRGKIVQRSKDGDIKVAGIVTNVDTMDSAILKVAHAA